MSKKRLSNEELREIAWYNAIKHGSQGGSGSFLLYPDGSVYYPIGDYDRPEGAIAEVSYESAFDYDDLGDYAKALGKKDSSDLTKKEVEDFIEGVANNPPDEFELEEYGWPYGEGEYPGTFETISGCPRGYHKVNGYRRKDGTYVKEHCARDPMR